jgi:hypothetical protein
MFVCVEGLKFGHAGARLEEGRDTRAEDTGILGDNFFGPEILPAKLREEIFEGDIFFRKRNSSRNFAGRNFVGDFFCNFAGTNVGEPGILVMSVELACGIVLAYKVCVRM